MDFGQPLIPNSQSAELMQPSNTAFDHPASFPQTAAMRCSPSRQFAVNTTHLQSVAMRLRIVSPITLHTPRFSTRASSFTRNWRDRIHQWQQLSDVVAVGLGQHHAQRNAVRFDEDMVLAARFTPIGRVWACFFPPCTARINELSTITRDRSSLSAPRSCDNNTACSRSQTPAFCQSRKRRQQVMPDPQPISCGNISHGMPVCNTNRIPVRARRSSNRLRPGYRCRRGVTGSSDSIIDQSPSSTSCRAIRLAASIRCRQACQHYIHFVRCS